MAALPLVLHPDRLFPADPATRGLARALYATVAALPIVSPHGHTDPQWYADDAPFPDASALFITPDHYVFRMLYSQGIRLEDLGIPRRDGAPVEKDARKIWRTFAAHYHLFRGTPTRVWLDHAFATVFGCDERLTAESADRTFDRINACLARPEFRPRALFERFNIEVIATTESPLDPLEQHRKLRASGWKGRVITAYRPDPVVDPEFEGFRGERAAIRRAGARGHGDLEGLPRRASGAARLFQDDGRHVDGSRPPDGAHLRPSGGAVPAPAGPRARGNGDRGRGRAVPRADADRDGADEPRRRARDADPSRLVPQPQSARLPRLRPRQGRRHPDAPPTTSAP